ncbi:hypothetical protein K1719_022870 [Acacia pycnantha]|nr:hypothetical protein K1719_022870 [Acacia pycnantha]
MLHSSYARNRTAIAFLFLAVIATETRFCFSSKVYVVYMGSKTGEDPDDILKQHHLMLSSVHSGSVEEAQASHVYSYRHGFRGFAAKLTDEQASQISDMPGVVSVFPNSKRILHTTHSWDFMELPDDNSMKIFGHSTRNQADVIVGIIDTGIWPESPSFEDKDMPPVPSKWKGHCQKGEAFNDSSCNRKVIGARYYASGFEAEEGLENTFSYKSPRDSSGHGSHTASTAVGRHVANISYTGLGAGEARGGAPMSRIAVYKTCWDSGCYDADLLAAFDDAIHDGVHILSLSIGPEAPQGDYFSDAISVGSFHAASHGVLVVSSAGNIGNPGSATNLAPWMITVGASSTDRDFISDVRLGNGVNIKGESLSILEMKANTRILPASEASAGYFTPYQSSYCVDSSLNATKAKGNVLVCRHEESSTESKVAKTIIPKKTGEMILSYVNSTRKPTSRIFRAKTVLGTQPAPLVATFSSKGPNSLTPEILKPDITAPGLNILAAWSPAKGNSMYNINSGTSMSCPHVTGIAALVKTVHPSWSPSAIKSAIMTTATTLDKQHETIRADPGRRKANAFDYGSGFVNPAKVLDPGLIYDIKTEDYIEFLCSLNYDDKSLQLVTGDNSTCHGHRKFKTASDLNYPSITVPNLKDNFSVSRTVTNVGEARSIYTAEVSSPAGVKVTVVPNQLNFTRVGQIIKFTVNFKVVAPSKGYSFGFLSWKNRRSQVTSPLVVQVAAANLGMVW